MTETRPEKACGFCPWSTPLKEANCHVVKTITQLYVVVHMASD